MKSPTAAKYQQEHCAVIAPEIAPVTVRVVQERVSKYQPTWNDRIAAVRAALPAMLPGTVQLNSHSIIRNPLLFIDTHLEMVTANNGNPRFLVYLERLEYLTTLL